MKNNVLLLMLFVLSVSLSYGQASRRVMVEEATNASCGPCASQNPAFDALLQQNADMVSVVKYHASWPGYDPMYNHNTDENSSRISYYGIGGVPTAVVDGLFNGSPSQVTQTMLNNYANSPSPFEEIDIYHYLSPNQDSIYVFMRIQAAQDISENFLKGHCAIVEKHIHFNTAPGSNGEKDFYDVMKKMLPDVTGTALKTNWTDGEYKVIARTWKLENVYDVNQLSVVGFVQNSNTKVIHQSGVGSTEPFEALFAIDATPAGITNLTSTTCLSTLAPEVSIANFGADNLTSLDIHYSINGSDEQMLSWNGNIEYLKLSNVQLPEIAFDLMEENQLKVYFSNTNGTGDDYPANDTLYFGFHRSIVVPESISLIIKLDNNPGEITWEVVNPEGEIVFEGGPYSTPNGFISQTMEFDVSDCYKFTIHDSGNNGLTLPGFFSLFKGSQQILTGSDFGAEASQMFLGETAVGIGEPIHESEIKIYPNPVSGAGIVSFILVEENDVRINLINQMGQMIKTISNKRMNAGVYNVAFETSELQSGFYFMEITTGNTKNVQKISIVK
ncbi:MAG: T9SS type A sorting domain-containing protein [Bacteroidales bacterium]|nr:T9SS type A sorting domain-containing protein [Bacteroidales bacterium]